MSSLYTTVASAVHFSDVDQYFYASIIAIYRHGTILYAGERFQNISSLCSEIIWVHGSPASSLKNSHRTVGKTLNKHIFQIV